MSGITPVSSYVLLNNTTSSATTYKAQLDGNSIAASRISANYAPYGSTAMTVHVSAGHIYSGGILTESSAWISSAIVAPVSNTRIDRVTLNQTTGVPAIVTGIASSAPSAPAIPSGYSPIAQILLSTATTALGNSTLTDERDFTSAGGNPIEAFIIACSDETTALSSGTSVVTMRIPYAFTLTDIRGTLSSAASGATLLSFDVKETGTSIFSTLPTFPSAATTTVGSTAPYVFADTSLADNAVITVDIDSVGSSNSGKGLKVSLIGKKT